MNATVEFVSRFGSCGSSVSTGTGVGVRICEISSAGTSFASSVVRIPSATTAVCTAVSSSLGTSRSARRLFPSTNTASTEPSASAASAASRSATGRVRTSVPCPSPACTTSGPSRVEPVPSSPRSNVGVPLPPYALRRMSPVSTASVMPLEITNPLSRRRYQKSRCATSHHVPRSVSLASEPTPPPERLTSAPPPGRARPATRAPG